MLTEEEILTIFQRHDDETDAGAIAIGRAIEQAAIAAYSSRAHGEPVAEVESWTNGSYHRNYKLRWLKDVEAGAKLYTQSQPQTDGWPEVMSSVQDADGRITSATLQVSSVITRMVPSGEGMMSAMQDAKRYRWLRAQHEMQDMFEDSEGFTVRGPAESAWTVFRPGRTASLEPVGCIPGELDKAIDTEIERLGSAKENPQC